MTESELAKTMKSWIIWVITISMHTMMVNSAPSIDSSGQIKGFLNTSIDEEVPGGTYVITVPLKAGIIDDAEIRYNLLDSLDSRYFSLDPNSGVLSTAGTLDREKLCADASARLCCSSDKRAGESDSCVLQAQITVMRGQSLHSIMIAVTLRDTNDNSPQFSRGNQQTIEIMENAQVGSVVHHFNIIDTDAEANGKFSVHLQPELSRTDADPISSIFKLQESRDGVDLVLLKQLDREVIPEYKMVMVAIDGGKYPRTSSATLTVKVGDVNDNQPEWITKNFSISFPENKDINSIIFQLHAQDKDTGNNGRITYAIDRQNARRSDLDMVDKFSVDPNSGKIRLMGQLDFDQQSLIEVPVIAKDSGNNPMKSVTALLQIHLTDINDNAPTINVLSLMPDKLLSVWENIPPGQSVATVLVNDRDTGPGGQVTCRIDSPDFHLDKVVGIGGHPYNIISLKSFDREKQSLYNVMIICHDNGIPRLESRKSVEIRIRDANDNPPKFEKSLFIIEFDENNPIGQTIATINATDADEGSYGRLKFSLNEKATDYVRIHPSTGTLTAKTIFDRETTPVYNFRVYATDDNGNKGSTTASAEIQLNILDTNDHEPQFSTNMYFFSVLEGSPVGTHVGTVHAEDKDLGDNARVFYHLITRTDQFSLNPTTGDLTVRSPAGLDREAKSSFELRVMAQDFGKPVRRRSQSVIHVNLDDINDHTPIFVFPSKENNYVNVSCSELANHIVTRVYANDSDIGPNAKIEYSVISSTENKPTQGDTEIDGSMSSQFDIDIHGGQLMLLRPFRHCGPGGGPAYEEKVVIRAADQGQPSRSATAVLLVRVLNQPPANQDDGSFYGRSNQFASSHWTVVVGLVVATVILVLLFCSILIMMRKRFLLRDDKHYADTSENNQFPPEIEKMNTMRVAEDPGDPNSHYQQQTFYYASCEPDVYKYIENPSSSNIEEKRNNRSRLYQTDQHPTSCHALSSVTNPDRSYQTLGSAAPNTDLGDRTYHDYNRTESFLLRNKYTYLYGGRELASSGQPEVGSQFVMAGSGSSQINSDRDPDRRRNVARKLSSSNSLTDVKGAGSVFYSPGNVNSAVTTARIGQLDTDSMTSSGVTSSTVGTLPHPHSKLKNPYCTVSFV